VERYEQLRSEKVDPRVDNALSITTDGRKLAVDVAQIVMRSEERPRRSRCANDLDVNGWPALKQPPCE